MPQFTQIPSASQADKTAVLNILPELSVGQLWYAVVDTESLPAPGSWNSLFKQLPTGEVVLSAGHLKNLT